MTTSDKIKIILLTIITLGLIWIWINKKQTSNKELTVDTKIKVNIDSIIEYIGAENIMEIINTHQRIKIIFKDRKDVNKEELEKLKGVSGTMFTTTSVSLVVGKSAAEVAKRLKLKLKK
ncbi:MAG: hypothetical protein HRT98_00705 [Mycoplasmatales bacterium]|nr:hypothetical protein [Mycoplasmatales bacterium]